MRTTKMTRVPSTTSLPAADTACLLSRRVLLQRRDYRAEVRQSHSTPNHTIPQEGDAELACTAQVVSTRGRKSCTHVAWASKEFIPSDPRPPPLPPVETRRRKCYTAPGHKTDAPPLAGIKLVHPLPLPPHRQINNDKTHGHIWSPQDRRS